jgi:DNA-binding MurR/RpiR family transcriptional regulator
LNDLSARLRSPDAPWSGAQAVLARFFDTHQTELPYETAASIARRLNLSPMTVGRFLRRLGYQDIDDLKTALRRSATAAWRMKDSAVDRLSEVDQGDLLARALRSQIEGLEHVFQTAKSATFREVVKLLSESERVYVAGFQSLRGMAIYFASQLEYARPGVQMLDGLNGTFAELLEPGRGRRCLVAIDTRRYARKIKPLIERAAALGISTVAIADVHLPGSVGADHVLTLPEGDDPLWDSDVDTVALLDLLLNGVAVHLGPKARRRVEALADAQDFFEDFDVR